MADDFAHMDTDAVSTLMRALGDVARDLDDGWQSLRDAIAGGEGAIGADRIGQAIRGAYEPARTMLHDAADRMPRAMLADADVGEACAIDYRAADARGSAVLGAVLGLGGFDAHP